MPFGTAKVQVPELVTVIELAVDELGTQDKLTLEIVLAPLFATYKLPEESKARPSGALSPLLTMTETKPLGVTLEMVFAFASATQRLPEESKARLKQL
jgi:hypothetical protein